MFGVWGPRAVLASQNRDMQVNASKDSCGCCVKLRDRSPDKMIARLGMGHDSVKVVDTG
jgi:hypothetical protein